MIEVKNLSYQKGKKEILRNMNIKIHKNKIMGILGPNGSGKTTLLKHLVREIESSNTIFLEGIPIEKISRKNFAKKIAFVAQNIYPIEEIFIEDLIKMGRYPYKKLFLDYRKEDIKIVEEVLQLFQLENLKGKAIGEVSGGELKRAFLARAFTQQAEVIVLDEPTNHLDIKHQLDLMRTLRRMKDKTIVCSIHDISLAMEFCDEVILLKDGEVIDCGETQKVLREESIEKVFEITNRIEKIGDKSIVLYYD